MLRLTCILYITALVSFSCKTEKEVNYQLKDYLLSEVGIQYQFKNLVSDGMDTILVGINEEIEYKGITTQKRYENNGDYRLQTLDENGLSIYYLYFIGDRIIEYEKPVVQIPATLVKGDSYQSQTKYDYLEDNEIIDQGIQYYEVKVHGLEDLQMKNQTVEQCLVMTTKASRIGKSGKEKGYELKEWYAPGAGAIKVEGPLFWNDEKGNRSRTFQINAELERSMIAGKAQQW